jgi:Protein of unknown function (DUF2783)
VVLHLKPSRRNIAMDLKHETNVADPDGFYATIIEAHEGLTEAQSIALNARLVLLLANHIGDVSVLCEALFAARASISN